METPVSVSMRGMFQGQACAHMPATDAKLRVDRAGARLLVGLDSMDRAVLHAPRVGALLAVLDGELACARVAVAERAFARVGLVPQL